MYKQGILIINVRNKREKIIVKIKKTKKTVNPKRITKTFSSKKKLKNNNKIVTN